MKPAHSYNALEIEMHAFNEYAAPWGFSVMTISSGCLIFRMRKTTYVYVCIVHLLDFFVCIFLIVGITHYVET